MTTQFLPEWDKLVETINDWLWEIDEHNIFTYSNPFSRQLLGYEPEELVGKSIFDLIPKEDAQHVEESLKYNAEMQEPFVGIENIVYHKDGTEIFLDTNGTPIFDAEGIFCGFRGIGRDITERHLLEESFIKAKQVIQIRNLYNQIILQSTSETALINEICQVMVEIVGYRLAWIGFVKEDKSVIPATQFGYDNGYLENVTDIEPACTAIRTGQLAMAQVVDNASAIALPLFANNNKIFAVLNAYSSSPEAFDDDEISLLQNLTNDLAHGIIALRDAAERKRAEEALRKSEKMASLGRLTTGFAHELNTPIGVALGAASHLQNQIDLINGLLQQEEINEEELFSALETINQATKLTISSLTRTANLVKVFKQAAVDQGDNRIRPFEVKYLFENVIKMLHENFKETAIDIQLDCPDDSTIYSLPEPLMQIANNLIMNSLVHGFEEGKKRGSIRIVVRLEKNRFFMDYSDTGKGMTPDALEKVFEPFFTTYRGHGGSGLGMYICHNLVTSQLKGTMACESAPGKGVLFKIRFPTHKP